MCWTSAGGRRSLTGGNVSGEDLDAPRRCSEGLPSERGWGSVSPLRSARPEADRLEATLTKPVDAHSYLSKEDSLFTEPQLDRLSKPIAPERVKSRSQGGSSLSYI